LRRIGLTVLCMVLTAALVSECGDGGAPMDGDRVLNRSLGSEPESLDVHLAASNQAATVLRDLGEGLTGYAADGTLVAAAAERWDTSEDGLHYRFTLRPEARWSNGEPVLAEHFVCSFRRLVDPQTAGPYAEFMADIANARAIVRGELPPESLGVVAEGPQRLLITLERPVPYFLSLLTHNSTFPVFPDLVRKHGTAYARPGILVSNGAYRLDEWRIGSLITLSRNEYYWNNAKTAIDRVRYVVSTEPMTELNRYRAGEIDITNTVPSEMFEVLKKQRPAELRIAPTLEVYYYGLNVTKPPFRDNEKLRQALSMAIDREDIVRNVTARGETPAYGWVPPGVADYGSMKFAYALQPREERHASARRLYREAGYGPDKPLQVEIRFNTSETHRRVAVAVQAMWRNVLGFEAKLVNEEFQVLLSNMLAKEVTQVFRSSWSGDYNDAHAFLSVLQSNNPSNLTGYSSKEFDSLMERSANQTDPLRRRYFLEEAERTLLTDHPVIPLYFYVSKHLVSPRVLGWQDNPLDYHYSQHLSLTSAE